MRKGWVLTVATVLMACVCAFAGCLAKKPQVIKKSDTYIVINVSEKQKARIKTAQNQRFLRFSYEKQEGVL